MLLSHTEVEGFLKKYKTRLYEAHGAIRKDWVVIPDRLLEKTAELAPYFEVSYSFVKTLKAKTTAKR